MRIYFFVLCFVIAGCATDAPISGLPIWDFHTEHNKLHEGVWLFNPNNSSSIGDYLLDFSPPELVHAISQALDNTKTQLVPETLNNLTYPYYDFQSPPKASNPSKWGIAVKNENLLVTDWKFIPGKKVGFFWWEKEYETQVRHRIIVNGLNKSGLNTNFLICTEVRERPNENLPWQEGLVEFGQKSFEELKNLVVDTITTKSKILSDVE